MNGKLISLSTMRPVRPPECAVGQIVRFTGDIANPSGMGAVIAIRPAGQFGPKSYDVALTDGREFCGTFLDGSRWEVSAQLVDAEAIAILRAGVEAAKAAAKAAKSAADQAFADALAKLKADFAYLEQGSGPVVAARNLRLELEHYVVRAEGSGARVWRVK